MKFKLFIAVFTVFTLILGSFNIAYAANGGGRHKSVTQVEGKVVNVIQDEEGTNIMMRIGRFFKSIYVPRSNKNQDVTDKAIEAQRTQKTLKVITGSETKAEVVQ